MGDRLLTSLLLDFYGALLTERQRECFELHYEEDLSLGEIAVQLGVSRQAVHDNLHRAMQLLEMYEDKLHLVDQYQQRQQTLKAIKSELNKEIISKQMLCQLVAQMEG